MPETVENEDDFEYPELSEAEQAELDAMRESMRTPAEEPPAPPATITTLTFHSPDETLTVHSDDVLGMQINGSVVQIYYKDRTHVLPVWRLVESDTRQV